MTIIDPCDDWWQIIFEWALMAVNMHIATFQKDQVLLQTLQFTLARDKASFVAAADALILPRIQPKVSSLHLLNPVRNIG